MEFAASIGMRLWLYIFFMLGLLFADPLREASINSTRAPSSCMDSSAELPSLAPPPVPVSSDDEVFDFKKMNEWLPAQIDKEEKGTTVMSRIADKGFQNFMASDRFKSSSLGSLNEQVKQQTKIEMSLKPEGQKLEHKIKAQLQPFQGGATVSYQGYFGLDLSFLPASDTQVIKIEETVFNKKLFYENSLGRNERLDQVGVRWDW